MRYLSPELERFFREERKMGFLAGPRQVGKTTLARAMLEVRGGAENYFNWDVESHRKAILRSPEDFWRSLPTSAPPLVVLDEIHKFPRWKRFLKGLYDSRGAELRVLVTGSGRLDVFQRGGDSLFGRHHLYRLHPFSVGELLRGAAGMADSPERLQERIQAPAAAGAADALDSIERFSGFPEPLFAASETRLRRWRGGRRSQVLREDLRDLTRIREIGLIDALVELLPERVGAPLSLNALREDLGVAYGTVRGWMEALSRLYYLFEIRPYAGTLARALRREGKVYLFDPTVHEDAGRRFENIAALHLLKACHAWSDLGHGEFSLHYLRDKEKREVDFLVLRERKPFLMAEAKLSQQDISPSLRYFAERLRPRHRFQLIRHAAADALSRAADGIDRVSAARFFAALP